MENSPDPRPLPERPDLEQLRRQAKELLQAARVGDRRAIERLGDGTPIRLASAQHAIAREFGFESWPRLRRAVLGPRLERAVITRPPRSGKHLAEGTFRASAFLDAAKRNGWVPGRLPSALIIVFQPVYANHLANDDRFAEDPSMAVGNGRYFVTVSEPAVAVSCMSGGTAFVSQVENQVALGGADRFVILNSAGGLSEEVRLGEIVVIGTAVRDDGISDHYLPPGDTVDADDELTDVLLDAVRSLQPDTRRQVSWTIPAVYRQTEAEVEHCRSQGVAVVESEVAALFAVCEALDVQAGAVVTVSGLQPSRSVAPSATPWDVLFATQWNVFDVVVSALQRD